MSLLMETHARLTRVLGAELRSGAGLPLSWFELLLRLRRAESGFLTMSQLATEISLTSGGVTRLVDRLVEAGLVERRDCPSDRRSVYVALTAAGTARLDDALALHLEGIERHLLDPLSAGERAALEEALSKVLDAAD